MERVSHLAGQRAIVEQLQWQTLGGSQQNLLEEQQRLSPLVAQGGLGHSDPGQVALACHLEGQRLAPRLVLGHALNGCFKDGVVALRM